MSKDGARRGAVGTKGVELVVAALFIALGALVIYDSRRLGTGWADDGPQAGYFPFYLGLIICIASAVTFFKALTIRPEHDKVFVDADQFKLVLAVLVPTVVYVGCIGFLGIYVASILFIGFFMRWQGQYSWAKVVMVPLSVMGVFFFVFEVWFKVPLPKGPLEAALGLN
jgi:putative tricarboxylic transport membrane protein